mmetsp:Transcript_71881/g.138888  ORF Transcript_71881/g.138888 Transcript_71881/m.138888 type:complete len:331 (+) Transcript_71881:172-1164(+)
MLSSNMPAPHGRNGVPKTSDSQQKSVPMSGHDARARFRNTFLRSLRRSDGPILRSDGPKWSMCQPADGPAFVHHQPMQCMHTNDFALLGSQNGPTRACDWPLRNVARYDSGLAGLQPGLVEEGRSNEGPTSARDRTPRILARYESDPAGLQPGLVEVGQALNAKFLRSCKLLDEHSSAIWRGRAVNTGTAAQEWHQFEADKGKGLRTYFKHGAGISLKEKLSAKSTSASKSETTPSSTASLPSTLASDFADPLHASPDSKSKSVEGKLSWAPDSRWDGIMRVGCHKHQRKAFVEENMSGNVRQCDALVKDSDNEGYSSSDGGPAVLDCGP